jgi:hypothetical protein
MRNKHTFNSQQKAESLHAAYRETSDCSASARGRKAPKPQNPKVPLTFETFLVSFLSFLFFCTQNLMCLLANEFVVSGSVSVCVFLLVYVYGVFISFCVVLGIVSVIYT